MAKRMLKALIWSASALIGSAGIAHADMVGRYQCTIVGPSVPEPVGDIPDHAVQTAQYSCVGIDGLFKGAIMTGNAAIEWQGGKSTFLAASTTHRTPGGIAVAQLLEGTGALAMAEGKPLGNDAAGKAAIRLASGALASLSGKTLKWTTKPVGFNRFEQSYYSE
ncbi:hypothetical protein [uncultured Bradyrhizobium sp.]|jgi:hypothetical protein|uniref:hypothetical protein n=1 Tax=uncultured Bradyrhizobium sp. TaxID=199684 RepID=UPI002625A102|nr:hypothetical protein [uncultured Bradyrhizobium sp.]